MDHLFSLFLVSAGGIALVLVIIKFRWLFWPILLALFFRIGTALIHRYVFPLPQGSADALVFDRVALNWADKYGCLGFFEHYDPSASYVYSSVVATIYACVDYVPFSIQIINALFGVYGIIFLALASKEIWGAYYARRVALVLAIFPFLIIFSSVGLREAFIFFGFSGGVYYLTLFHSSKGRVYIIFSIIMFQFAALFHGAMALAIGAVVLGLTVKPMAQPHQTRQQFGIAFASFLVMLVIIVVGSFYSYSQLSIHKLGELEELSIGQIADIAASRSRGDAAYLSGLSINSFMDFVLQSPLRVFYFLFSPFPWNLSNPLHLIGFFDGVFYLTIFYWCFKYRNVVFRHPAAMQILILVLVLAFAFSFGTSNFGTATRHRAKFVLAILVVAAPCLFSDFRKSSRLNNS